MGERAAREFSRNWPILGVALVLWAAVVILRTPQVGIDLGRVVAIIVAAGSMIVVGVQIERLRRARELDEEEE